MSTQSFMATENCSQNVNHWRGGYCHWKWIHQVWAVLPFWLLIQEPREQETIHSVTSFEKRKLPECQLPKYQLFVYGWDSLQPLLFLIVTTTYSTLHLAGWHSSTQQLTTFNLILHTQMNLWGTGLKRSGKTCTVSTQCSISWIFSYFSLHIFFPELIF